MRPQVADLDADGHTDLVTGCFQGTAMWIRGVASGDGADLRFALPAPLLDEDGDPLRAGQYWDMQKKRWFAAEKSRFPKALGISAEPVDWDGDGDLDLVLGTSDGRVLLRRNHGTAARPAFAARDELVQVHGAGEELVPLRVDGGYSMPAAADWDDDGLLDLVSGSGSGAVVWWRNVGEPGAPRFGPPQPLTPAADAARGLEAPGVHSQVAVVDFDGDGDLDLLVGDRHREEDGTAHGFVWLYRRR